MSDVERKYDDRAGARDLPTQRNDHDAPCYTMRMHENKGRVKATLPWSHLMRNLSLLPGEVAQLSPERP